MKPFFSVILPCHNDASYLLDSIPSVLGQTFTDFELIVVNDGSTDESGRIAQNFPRVRYFEIPHSGLPAARNFGISQASGEFIALIDSDDIWLPRKLEHVFTELQKTSADIFYHSHFYFTDSVTYFGYPIHHEIATNPLKQLLSTRSPTPSVQIFRRECFQMVGGYDESLKTIEDLDLLVRFALARAKFAGTDEPLALYRLRKNNHIRKKANAADYLNLFDKWRRVSSPALNRYLPECILRCARYLILLGHPEVSRKILTTSARKNPQLLLRLSFYRNLVLSTVLGFLSAGQQLHWHEWWIRVKRVNVAFAPSVGLFIEA